MSKRLSPFILAAGALLMPLAQVAHSFSSSHQDSSMQASTTYLYLLRKTHFFTRLTTAQLREMITHSKEWEVKPGTVIAASGDVLKKSGVISGTTDVKATVDSLIDPQYVHQVVAAK